MDKMATEHSEEQKPVCQHEVAYLSIPEAARVLGVSVRSVYGYLERGKLSRMYVDGVTMLLAEEVATFERRAPGRVRTVTPLWRLPPEHNPMYLTTICVRLRPGCEHLLEAMIETFRIAEKHHLSGTSKRYIGRNQDDHGEVVIMLVWRGAAMPPDDQRAEAFQALSNDLSAVLDWSTAVMSEGQVLLHAG